MVVDWGHCVRIVVKMVIIIIKAISLKNTASHFSLSVKKIIKART